MVQPLIFNIIYKANILNLDAYFTKIYFYTSFITIIIYQEIGIFKNNKQKELTDILGFFLIENSIIQIENMNQLVHKLGQASPSPLVEHEHSQVSLSNSFVQKPKQSTVSVLPSANINMKKRLKFDQIFEENQTENNNILPDGESQQVIQIQFYISNCLKAISDFFKTSTYRYIYVIFLMLFLVNSTLESAQISDTVYKIAERIDIGFQIFFSIGILMKLTHFKDQTMFWLVLDLITNLSSYIAFGLSNYPEPVRYLKAIKILRLLMIIKESDYLQISAVKLIFSLSSVGKILFPAVLFIYFYAIIGLYSFRDYEYTKCRDPSNKLLSSNWTVYKDSIFLCGQKQCPIVNGVQFECINPIDYGVEPSQNEVMNIIQGNGLMRYSNIFYALFSTFKQTFITGSSRLMILGKQVTNYFYVLIYYLSFVYLLAYIYLNIFYGLMITNQEQAVDNRKQSSFELKLLASKKIVNIHDVQNKEAQQQNEQKSSKSRKPSHSIMIEPEKLPKTQLKNVLSNKIQNIEEIQQSQKSQLEQLANFKPNANPSTKTIQNNLILWNIHSGTKNEQKELKQLTEKQQILLKYGQIMKKYFFINHIIVILCSINILTDYQGQTHQVKLIVDAIDFVFFWVYLIEMIFRIIVHIKYIPKEPFDKVFKLDFFLFCLCTCGLAYEAVTAQSMEHFIMASDNPSKLLRTLKYLRIFILISSTPYFSEARIIFNSTLEAVYSVKSLLTLWLLVLVVFSIMGYHMFNGKTKINQNGDLDLVNGQPQKIGFEGIVDSFIYTVFIFFNQEWDWFLFQQYISQQFLIVIWQLIVLVVGLQVLSKYFMASLMKELGEKLNQQNELVIQDQQNEDYLGKILFQDSNLEKMNSLNQKKKRSSQFTLKLKSKQLAVEPQIIKKNSQEKMKRTSRMSINRYNGVLEIKELASSIEAQNKRTQAESMMKDIILRDDNQAHQIFHMNDINTIKPSNDHTDLKDSLPQFTFLQETRMRLFILLKSKVYIFVRVLFILVSIVCTLVMNPNVDPDSTRAHLFTKIWYLTVAFFFLQILLSIFAFGVLKEKTGYLRNAINWIYIFVIMIEILSIIPGLIENANLQSLLSFRILRIFVFIELKYEADSDMRLTIVAFWKLLPKVLNLLAITIIMYGLFAIILVKLYKDDFYYCDGQNSSATILTSHDCMSWGGSWIKRRMNVSNILNSLIYLFLLATTQGWSVQVIESASLTGKGNQPQYGHSIWMEYFLSIFFFFGNMIMLNIFIGLSVNNFQKIKSQVTGLARLSKDNKMWFSIKNTIYRLKPTMKDSPPQNFISQKVHMFMDSKAYKIISTILLILFLINMSLYTTNMTQSKQLILNGILDAFMVIFIMEYISLWVGNGNRAVKKKIFLFSTVSTIYFIVLLTLTHSIQIEPKLDRILHGIVVCLLSIRCFTILYQIDFVRKMINSLLSIFPQTSNIWLLIFIVLFTYAVIGIYFFGYLKISPELNQFDQNYTDLPSAMYALIKFSTLESPMIQIIDSTAEIQPNSVCYEIQSYSDFLKYGRMGCGRPAAGYIFFLSFQLIYTMILLSTLMAVIVDAYSEVRRQQESMVNKFQLEQVQKEWQNFDPEATGYISYRDFWIFTAKLVKIYKVNKEELLSNETKQSFLKSLKIPIYEDENGVLSFQFHEVVEALTRIVVKQKMGFDWKTDEADKVFKNQNHNNSQIKRSKKSGYDSSHVLTLIILKSGLKVWKRKAVGVVENHRNLQNLFSIAKRQKDKAGNSNHSINSQNSKNNNEVKPQSKQTNQITEQLLETMTKKDIFETKSYENNYSKPIHQIRSPKKKLSRSPHEPNSIERKQKILIVQNTSPKALKKKVCDLEEIK